MALTGNRGEWAEIYIFLKLMYDRVVYAADKDMNKIDDVFLKIIEIIREEHKNRVYVYKTGDKVHIFLNNSFTGIEIDDYVFLEKQEYLLDLMSVNKRGNFSDYDMEEFLSLIQITKLKAPAVKSNTYFGGTQDITLSVVDPRSGVNQTIGFSCKSDFAGRATLFNASKNNTNFIYEITGDINDSIMSETNGIFRKRKDKLDIAIGDRIRFLKEAGCDIEFVSTSQVNAERNLVLSGGIEFPSILGEALKYYFWIGEGSVKYAPISQAIDYVIENNPAKYKYNDIYSVYRKKFSDLLYNMFTGMRLGASWDGKSSVNGGYIVMKDDGDVLAYHSCITDEFKEFLLNRLGFESPSASRHEYLDVYKENGKYYINLNLQIRFI
ncbi:MAG: HpaII family restriction endonuclease [Oscillospiraceae bacterium]|nr:HpaII family restriction endonuclease [Oscillospiraceae bacterium]